MTFRLVVAPLRGPGQSPVLPFACCVGSLLSVGRCGRCSCWCCFRVRGAQWLVCWGCAGCGMVCPLRVSGAQQLANWGCAGCCRGRLTVFAVHTPPSSGRPQPASLRFHVREAQVPCSSVGESFPCLAHHSFPQGASGPPAPPLLPSQPPHPPPPPVRIIVLRKKVKSIKGT